MANWFTHLDLEWQSPIWGHTSSTRSRGAEAWSARTTDLDEQVRCRRLIFHSRDGLRVAQVLAPDLAAHIPDSRLVLLNSRHHVLTQAEPAWPEFLQELDWFLGPTRWQPPMTSTMVPG
ncbi:MAG: hypothetical protein WKF47_04085 [Geodermatophilaceae bacterium]